MKQWLIGHPEIEGRYWSLYGWAPQIHALRFPLESDADLFRQQNGMADAKTVGMDIDDNRRPDAQTDYNPFST